MGAAQAALAAAELLSALLASIGTVFGWRRRALTRAALPFAIMQSMLVGWALAAAWGIVAPSREHAVVSELVSFVMSTNSSSAFLWFALMFTGSTLPLSQRTIGRALLSFAAVTVLLAAAEPWLHLMYGTGWHGERPQSPFGPLYLPLAGVAFAMSLLSIWMLVRCIRRGSVADRKPAGLVLAGMFCSTAPVLVDGMLGDGYPRRELIPLYLIASSLLYLRAVLQQGMLGIVPLARHRVMERISDAVLVLGPDDVVLDANEAAERLLASTCGQPHADGITRLQPIGRYLADVLPDGILVPDQDGRHELGLPLPHGGRIELQVTRDPLHDRRGHRVGAVLVARDVTELNEKTARLEESNARLREQLETISALRAELAELAVRDELTGLHNRRYLVGRLDEAVHQAGQDGGAVSLVVFDVDHFKRVNDTYGHMVGDRVLRAIADALAESTRAGDVISRHGGEEFVLLLPGCPEAAARDRAEQLRHRIEQISVPLPSGEVTLTVSAGVATIRPAATCDQSERSAVGAALVAAADRALYRAKDSGRNLVLCADSAA